MSIPMTLNKTMVGIWFLVGWFCFGFDNIPKVRTRKILCKLDLVKFKTSHLTQMDRARTFLRVVVALVLSCYHLACYKTLSGKKFYASFKIA